MQEQKKKIRIAHNFFDYDRVIRNSLQELEFQKDSEIVTNSVYGIGGIVDSKCKKIISIGRFSPEKGHIRLMEAFDEYWTLNKDAHLIIIGGTGVDYNKELRFRKSLKSWQNISFIKSINNPMPILKNCDLFVLSSFYEGLGLVLMEAAALKVPCISTDITGPRLFMKKYNGILVENSKDGIFNGIINSDTKSISPLAVNFEEYNNQCKEEFENLFANN